MEIEIPVFIVKNLVYDVNVGTDTLRKIHATIDFTNKTLECIVKNTQHTINLGHTHNTVRQCGQNAMLQKPAVYRMDKITSHGQCTADKQTAGQENQLHNNLSKHKSILKILAVKYTLPDNLKIKLKLVNLEQQDAKLRKIGEEIQ